MGWIFITFEGKYETDVFTERRPEMENLQRKNRPTKIDLQTSKVIRRDRDTTNVQGCPLEGNKEQLCVI